MISDSPLRDYFGVLWRRKVIVVLAVLVAATSAFLLSNRQPKIYSATGQILITSSSTDLTDDSAVETERRVLESAAVKDVAQQTMPNLPSVHAGRVGTSRIITATVEHGNPKVAADATNTYIQAFVQYVREQQVTQLQSTAEKTQAKLAQLRPQLDVVNIDYINSEQAIQTEYAPRSNDNATVARDRDQQRTLAFQDLERRLGPQRESLNTQVLVLNSQLLDATIRGQLDKPPAQIVTPAGESNVPISPKPTRDAFAGVAFGLLLGAALAFGFDFLEDTVKSRFDVERAIGSEPTVIATVPSVARRRGAGVSPLTVVSDPFSPASEAYRSLRTSVQFLALDSPLNTLSITSPGVGDGKTTTLANLAVATARTGRRVVLVDSDLRRPAMHTEFGLSNDVGLTSVMVGDCSLEDALQTMPDIPRLALLASGPLPPNPSELLSLRRFPEVLAMLRDQADLVLIDSPPLLPVTDPAIIAATVDGVIVVVSEGTTTRKQLRQAFSTLRQVDAHPVGIVLNNSESDDSSSYGYYRRTPPKDRRSWRPFRRRKQKRMAPVSGPPPTKNGKKAARRGEEVLTGPSEKV